MRSWLIALALVLNVVQIGFAAYVLREGGLMHWIGFFPVWATPPVSILALSVAWWSLRQASPAA